MKLKPYIEEKIPATYLMISICLAAFLAEMLYGFVYGEGALYELFNLFGFSVQGLFQGNFWGLITSIFLHASPEHLILNMIVLFFFGKVVEVELGWKKFLLIFFVSGIVGDLATVFAGSMGWMDILIPTVGASAAIFGLMGTAMIIKPLEFVFFPYLIPIPLILVAVLYTVYNIIAFASVLIVGVSTNIAYIAHIGGLIVGMMFGFKHEGRKKGLVIAVAILLLMVLTPFFLYFLGFLELINYASLLTRIFT